VLPPGTNQSQRESGKPTQPDPNRPNTTVTPNQQIPVITNAPVQSPGSVVNPQGTVTPAVSGTAC
jgi:hypothetical protein